MTPRNGNGIFVERFLGNHDKRSARLHSLVAPKRPSVNPETVSEGNGGSLLMLGKSRKWLVRIDVDKSAYQLSADSVLDNSWFVALPDIKSKIVLPAPDARDSAFGTYLGV